MLKPHYFFLVVGLCFGLSFLVITPPFQVPDEVNHFFRAYHIAEGNLVATKQDNRLGGYVPKSLKTTIELNLSIKGSPFTKTSWKNIGEQINQPLTDLTPEFVDFPNTALYTPISYIPQALSIAVSKRLGATPTVMLYVTRLVMLLLWIFAMFYAIKSLPIFPWFFTIIALIPMCVFINMSVSADVVTNILGLLWISQVFKWAFGAQPLSKKGIISLFVLAILLASAKYVYTPLVLLILLIPKEKYVKSGILSCVSLPTSLILVAFLVAYLGSSFASKTYIARAAYNPAYTQGIDIQEGADVNAQMQYLIAKPFRIVKVVTTGFDKTFPMLYNTYIGVLGCLDVRLPNPVVPLSYLTILLVLLYENGQYQAKIKAKQRILLLLVGLLLTFLIYLSQYLTWVSVGAAYCGSIQGRYFIPVFPCIFLYFYGIYLFARQKTATFDSSVSCVFMRFRCGVVCGV